MTTAEGGASLSGTSDEYVGYDLVVPVKLVPQKGRGRPGRWLYLPSSFIDEALGEAYDGDLYAQRIVLHPGKKQILIRLKKEQ